MTRPCPWCQPFQVSVVPAAPAGTATPGERLHPLPDSSHLSGLSGRGSHIFRRLLVRASAGGEGRRRNNLQGGSA